VTVVNLAATLFDIRQSIPQGVTVKWTSVPGFSYRVAAKTQLTEPDWMDLSGDITAVSTNTAWTDTTTGGIPQRFYIVRAETTNALRATLLTSNLAGNISNMTLSWASLPGQVYHVMFKNNLEDAGWTDLSGPLTADTTVASWTDIVPATIPQRFYRILAEP
jgi:hypothetical protein